jgi:hypothetical protein
MLPNPRKLRLGPLRKNWPHEAPDGSCVNCGGQCDGHDCGLHAAGCIYGGFSDQTTYWMIAASCFLYHGESDDSASE